MQTKKVKDLRPIEVEIDPAMKLMMLAARSSGLLGGRAYKKCFDQSPANLRLISEFLRTLADVKEADTEGPNGLDGPHFTREIV